MRSRCAASFIEIVSALTREPGCTRCSPRTDDALRRRQALPHDAQPAAERTELHLTVLDLAVRADHPDEAPVLIRRDREIRDQHGFVGLVLRQLHAREQAVDPATVPVLQDRAHLQHPRLRIDAVVEKVDRGFVRVAFFSGEPDARHGACLSRQTQRARLLHVV